MLSENNLTCLKNTQHCHISAAFESVNNNGFIKVALRKLNGYFTLFDYSLLMWSFYLPAVSFKSQAGSFQCPKPSPVNWTLSAILWSELCIFSLPISFFNNIPKDCSCKSLMGIIWVPGCWLFLKSSYIERNNKSVEFNCYGEYCCKIIN